MNKVLSCDIGGTFIKSAIIDEKGNIESKKKTPTPSLYDDFIKTISALASENSASISGIAAALPGGYDFTNDEVFAPNLPHINGKHIKEDIEKAAKIPAAIENDANLAALGEYTFVEKNNIKNMIFVTLGTGAGGGIIINGKLLPSAVTSFEIGHTCVIPEGRICGCGRRGCMDEYCTISGLIEEYKAAGGCGDIEPKILGELASKGDNAALSSFKSFSRCLARGLVNAANLFCPEKIKIGGGLSELSEYYLKDCISMFNSEIFPMYRGRVKIEIASLKNDAGILGAAAYFFTNHK